MYDVIILGGGPGGYAAAVKGAKAGLKIALIEKEHLGGTCLNWGCIPTKSLLRSSSIYNDVIKGAIYGIAGNGITADITAMIKRSRQISEDMRKGISFLMQKNNVEVIDGYGRITSQNKVVIDSGRTIEAKNIIIATGARPRHMPSIPIDGRNIIDSKDVFTSIDHIPESMIIVGSGAIGAEFATFFSQIGTKVTLVEYADHIAPLEDAEISSIIERSMRKSGIKTMVSTTVERAEVIDGRCIVHVNGKKGPETLESEIVLSAIGITANIDDIGLENVSIKCDKGKIIVDSHFRTNIDSIYAIGDVIATTALAHVATKEGESAISYILKEDTPEIDYSHIPSCIFTSPEIASVGYTETQIQKKGIDYIMGKFSYMASGKAAAGGMKDGIVKLIFETKSHQLLGAHLCGADVAEMIGECTLALVSGNTAEDLASLVHAHPTMHEAIMEAAKNALDTTSQEKTK